MRTPDDDAGILVAKERRRPHPAAAIAERRRVLPLGMARGMVETNLLDAADVPLLHAVELAPGLVVPGSCLAWHQHLAEIVFISDPSRPNSYVRLGPIVRALNQPDLDPYFPDSPCAWQTREAATWRGRVVPPSSDDPYSGFRCERFALELNGIIHVDETMTWPDADPDGVGEPRFAGVWRVTLEPAHYELRQLISDPACRFGTPEFAHCEAAMAAADEALWPMGRGRDVTGQGRGSQLSDFRWVPASAPLHLLSPRLLP